MLFLFNCHQKFNEIFIICFTDGSEAHRREMTLPKVIVIGLEIEYSDSKSSLFLSHHGHINKNYRPEAEYLRE